MPCKKANDPRWTLHLTTNADIWFVNADNTESQMIRTYGLLLCEVGADKEPLPVGWGYNSDIRWFDGQMKRVRPAQAS
jgi:hypothetical protein